MLEPIRTEKDKDGRNINIVRSTTLAFSPVYTFFLRQSADLMDNGYAYPLTAWKDEECEAVYAEFDGKVIGHIVYSTEKVKDKKMLWIVLSAVDNEHRGKGIYTILHKHFENIAKEFGCSYIGSLVHKNNVTRLQSVQKVGFYPVFNYMMKKII